MENRHYKRERTITLERGDPYREYTICITVNYSQDWDDAVHCYRPEEMGLFTIDSVIEMDLEMNELDKDYEQTSDDEIWDMVDQYLHSN